HRKALINPKLHKYGGRIVKLMGDGALVEFTSVVAAVKCAIDIQKAMQTTNSNTPEDRQIVFRIGIDVGDVILEGDDIYGDGVNIAARLEGIAEPGGVVISEDAWRQVQGKIGANFIDLGEQRLKNIERHVRVYQLDLGKDRANLSPAPAL